MTDKEKLERMTALLRLFVEQLNWDTYNGDRYWNPTDVTLDYPDILAEKTLEACGIEIKL